ncbi:hypothetical protein RKE25_23250 (plasmid) [Dyella sp. BiH032]|uniref:hypothetical protein n=1 Tax=Dyella sp. BiH032 TaxID=3075430 RepID=UPI002892CF63|nr:hypothetical protein [Dyella sp. BiH032]WNL48533.1 hypothetical protein RKE25_23250 [Dyella sp. BiH032]
MPIPFDHRPMSPAEVEEARARFRQFNLAPPNNAAQVAALKVCAVICAAAAVAGWIFFGGVVAAASAVFGLACWTGAKMHAWEPMRETDDFDPLNNRSLKELAELAQEFPAIGARVKEWLDAGDVIRERDLCACRVYMHKEGPRKARADALARLEALAE